MTFEFISFHSCSLKVAISKARSSKLASPSRHSSSSSSSSSALVFQHCCTPRVLFNTPRAFPPKLSYTRTTMLRPFRAGSSPRDTSSSSSPRLIALRIRAGEPCNVMLLSREALDSSLDEEDEGRGCSVKGWLKLYAMRTVRESRGPACGKMA